VAAASAAGLCETVLITHGESGRSGGAHPRCRHTADQFAIAELARGIAGDLDDPVCNFEPVGRDAEMPRANSTSMRRASAAASS